MEPVVNFNERQVNPDVRVFMNYRRLKQITRCNNFIKNHTEDVAQHSYYTSVLALMIGEELRMKGVDVDIEIMLKKALLHDTEEAITSDVPFNVKHRDPVFKEQIDKVLAEIAKEGYEGASQVLQKFYNIGTHSKDKFEGEIVDLADMIELGVYCFEEVNTGNGYMTGLLQRAIDISKKRNLSIKSDIAGELIDFLENATCREVASLNNL